MEHLGSSHCRSVNPGSLSESKITPFTREKERKRKREGGGRKEGKEGRKEGRSVRVEKCRLSIRK